jgi:hypothetical protein
VDVLELPWYSEMATIDIGGDMDAYLDRMSHLQGTTRWDMRTWWFIQQVPDYWFRWNKIDCDIWLALLDRSPQLFLRQNIPVQRFMWYRWNTAESTTIFDENL